ncbi:flagellar hook capping FlgD N-terminal domain-containing protein [Bacillus bombysepticus]|uniref:flagellar hook capping FlgD N-terminal domain-containing protein n=1 Tax=Bacillus bombysepticus TaxID=658666 RepID=UPI00301A1271
MEISSVQSGAKSDSMTKAMGMNRDMYMTLFLETVKNQNPFQTMQTSEMMQQVSQLGFMEQVEKMKDAVESMSILSTNNLFLQGAVLLNKNVSYLTEDGKIETGVPTSVRLEKGTMQYLINDKYVPAALIQEITVPKENGDNSSSGEENNTEKPEGPTENPEGPTEKPEEPGTESNNDDKPKEV